MELKETGTDAVLEKQENEVIAEVVSEGEGESNDRA